MSGIEIKCDEIEDTLLADYYRFSESAEVAEADIDFVLYGQSKYPDRTIDGMGERYKDIWDIIGSEYELFKQNPEDYREKNNP